MVRSRSEAGLAIAAARAALARGDHGAAATALLPVLERSEDAAVQLAVALLRGQVGGPATDALAAATDRLVTLVERQAAHIRVLTALLEEVV